MECLTDSLPFSQDDPPGRKSRYIVHEVSDGFRVEGRDRCPVEVRLSSNHTALEILSDIDGFHTIITGVGLYAYPTLLKWISWGLMREWHSPREASSWGGVQEWAQKQTERAVSYRVYGQWQRLLSLVPESKRLVAKAVFAATFSPDQGCEMIDELYQHPYLVSDVIHYRAAAIACRYAVELVASAGHFQRLYPEPGTERSAEFTLRLAPLYRPVEGSSSPRYARYFFSTYPELWPQLIDLLAWDWKALYSGSGVASRSISRTLMNLPGGVVSDLVYFPYIASSLTRPVVDRVELLTLLQLAKSVARGETPSPWLLSLVVQARRVDILAALKRLEAHLRRTFAPTRLSFSELLTFLCDYVSGEGERPHRGTIVGLTDKAIRWHRAEQEEHLQAKLARYDVEALTALPPIPLPENPAIQFLATVREVVLEGEAMQHCIASYSEQAVAGRCYLFHVEHQQSSASVMVDNLGRVVQSYGPHNSLTPAAAYGEQVLARWGRKMRGPVVDTGQDEAAILPDDLAWAGW